MLATTGVVVSSGRVLVIRLGRQNIPLASRRRRRRLHPLRPRQLGAGAPLHCNQQQPGGLLWPLDHRPLAGPDADDLSTFGSLTLTLSVQCSPVRSHWAARLECNNQEMCRKAHRTLSPALERSANFHPIVVVLAGVPRRSPARHINMTSKPPADILCGTPNKT